MKIVKIKKMSGERYKLTLENGEDVILQDQSMIDHGLLFKKEIDEELRKVLIEESMYYEIYHKTVSYIMKRQRSEKEVRKYLEKHELNKKDIDIMIQKLKGLHLIDDKKYASSFISDKLNFTNDGPLKIKKELEENEIDISIIEEVLEKIDIDASLNKMIRWCEKKIRLNKKHSSSMLKQKLSQELYRMGYEYSFIEDCISSLSFSNDVAIKKEYEILKQKLSKKYQNQELNYKIKEKLYQKGFSKEEINEVLEEAR